MSQSLKDMLAAKTAAGWMAAKTATVDEVAKEEQSKVRIFFGEFPVAVSFMTETGKPVHFYAGYHVTDDEEIIAFCTGNRDIVDVTDKVKLEDVPKLPSRQRGRSWAAASERSDPTVFTPQDLLMRAVAGSNTLTTAADSNS